MNGHGTDKSCVLTWLTALSNFMLLQKHCAAAILQLWKTRCARAHPMSNLSLQEDLGNIQQN